MKHHESMMIAPICCVEIRDDSTISGHLVSRLNPAFLYVKMSTCRIQEQKSQIKP